MLRLYGGRWKRMWFMVLRVLTTEDAEIWGRTNTDGHGLTRGVGCGVS